MRVMAVFANLPTYPSLPFGQNPHRIGVAAIQSANPADIQNWDNFNMVQAVDSIFPDNKFGGGTHSRAVIADMFNCFAMANMPHVALMRVVVVRGNDRYAYSIPHVFVSGITGAAATLKWNSYLTTLPVAQYPALRAALGGVVRPIDTIVKGIGDYGFGVSEAGLAQMYAHSERAAVLCLLYDAQHSIQDVIAAVPVPAPPLLVPPPEIIIQIKVAHGEGSCPDCRKLFNEAALVANPPYQLPSAFGAVARVDRGAIVVAPLIEFDNGLHALCTNFILRQHLSNKSGVPIGNIHIRVSHKTAAGGAAPTMGF